jgi:thiol-disulfide isomerase/thioredoxin
MRRTAIGFAICYLVSSRASAQTSQALPGCEPAIVVQRILDDKLDWKKLSELKYKEQIARRSEVLEALMAKYPRQSEPAWRLLRYLRFYDPDQLPAFRERFQKLAQAHPDDPLALYLAGTSLFQANTPESIRLLEKAKSMAPAFPGPLLELAYIYSTGKRADRKAMSENITAFFTMCPASTNDRAHYLAAKIDDNALQTKIASALRARLEKERSPKRLEEYSRLWGTEFRIHPPQEHAAVRRQVTQDLKRLESLNRRPDAEWLAFLVKGYKQSDATLEAVVAMEDRLLREFPGSDEAYEIVSERWRKAHKEPVDQKNTLEWNEYQEAYKQAVRGWVHDYPDNEYLQVYGWFLAIYSDDSLTTEEGVSAMDHYLAALTDHEEPDAWSYRQAADFLVQHRWQGGRALALMEQADEAFAKARKRELQNDNLSAEDEEFSAEEENIQKGYLITTRLQAAKLAGKPEAAMSARAWIERPTPEQRKLQSEYWQNRGLLAELEGRKADALAFYQLALQTRTIPPEWRRGKLQDDLMDEASALWRELGGSESAWQVWSKPLAAKAEELTEGRWEKPNKELPSFELRDMSGKKWLLKNLAGKSILINLWATWCGPCRTELPELQKLYEKVKDRKDIQVLTLNYDDNLGLVAPFLKENGYTFPVLPAYSFVSSLFDSVGIPQNWIIDSRGTWKWTQMGFRIESNWQESVIQRLESVDVER